jgi:hypothetical protein
MPGTSPGQTSDFRDNPGHPGRYGMYVQDNDKDRRILIENRCVEWYPAHFYRNHNGTGNQNTEAVYKIPIDRFTTENVK